MIKNSLENFLQAFFILNFHLLFMGLFCVSEFSHKNTSVFVLIDSECCTGVDWFAVG